jgi:choline-sulfatase
MDEVAPWTEGVNLDPRRKRCPRPPVAMEYAAEGTITPMVALREGAWKYIRCPADPDMLFDVANDPHESDNLATDPAPPVLTHFRALADQRWDLAAYDAAVRESQARRWVVYEALRNGAYFPWDHQPLRAASRTLHAQPHGPEHSRKLIASAIWGLRTVVLSSRSAMVRATRKTRW